MAVIVQFFPLDKSPFTSPAGNIPNITINVV